jgi:hypothetical protein
MPCTRNVPTQVDDAVSPSSVGMEIASYDDSTRIQLGRVRPARGGRRALSVRSCGARRPSESGLPYFRSNSPVKLHCSRFTVRHHGGPIEVRELG